MSPNPSGAPGMLARSCVNANSVPTGSIRISPFCRNRKNTDANITSSKIIVIIPVSSLVNQLARTSDAYTHVHTATVTMMLYAFSMFPLSSTITISITPGSTLVASGSGNANVWNPLLDSSAQAKHVVETHVRRNPTCLPQHDPHPLVRLRVLRKHEDLRRVPALVQSQCRTRPMPCSPVKRIIQQTRLGRER